MAPVMTTQDLHAWVHSRLSLVDAALTAHVEGMPADLPQAGAEYRRLWHRLGEQFAGGKNLRPALTLAAYSGLGGDNADAVVPVAASMEMLHTAMLVHDDILDHDEVRRGRPNVAGTRRAELAARRLPPAQVDDHVMTAALLSGDLALSSTYDMIARASLPAHHRLAALDLVTRAIRATIAGELLDMCGDLSSMEDADALTVAELKTATYSFVVPLLTGATIAGADPTMIAHLERIGTALGLSFQLVDDDLGVFGDPDVTGKTNLSDLRAGKRTELMRIAHVEADPLQRAILDRHVGDPALTDTGAAHVRQVLIDTGAREATLKLARRHARQARRIASERVPAPLSGYLTGVVDMLDGRPS